MTTALVPFSEMERMAITVAKSQLFGMRTADQALALMCLAQAEGIHPMIAVRDYHIINGRPSLKADTLLARFQEAGGKVEWHAMTDQRCEATFHHPDSIKPLRIEWTMDRAKQAGLADRDNWKFYPRPLLRSRVISEGVRATCPRVIAGKYTVEEAESIVAAEAVEVEVTPSMPREILEGHLSAIQAAASLDVLKRAYQEGYREARETQDNQAMADLSLAYNDRKAEITAEVAT